MLPGVKLLTQTTKNMLLKLFGPCGNTKGLVGYALSTSPKCQIKFQYFLQQVNICQIHDPLRYLQMSMWIWYRKSLLIIRWIRRTEISFSKALRKASMKSCPGLFPFMLLQLLLTNMPKPTVRGGGEHFCRSRTIQNCSEPQKRRWPLTRLQPSTPSGGFSLTIARTNAAIKIACFDSPLFHQRGKWHCHKCDLRCLKRTIVSQPCSFLLIYKMAALSDGRKPDVEQLHVYQVWD